MSSELSVAQRRSRVRYQAFFAALMAVSLFAFAAKLDFMERFMEWSEAHDEWQVDELFVLFIVGTVAFAGFARQQWSASGRELVVRIETERQLRASEQQLAHQAFHDPLTGLANRALFQNRLDHALASIGRDPGIPAVLVLDLDDFKRVNDTLGHPAGDALLLAVTDRLQRVLRPSDTFARLGGDEFAILLTDAHAPGDWVRIAERIIAEMRTPFDLAAGVSYVGASVGLVIVTEPAHAADVLRDADLAMYLSKSSGKGRFTVFEPPMHLEALGQRQLEIDLRQAVSRQEFVVHYQPIVAIATGTITGLEALVRWQHPDRGLMMPDQFIPLAEETRVIQALGQWVLREACITCRSLDASRSPGDAPISISVNLSGQQVIDPQTVDVVQNALDESGLDPARLILEITESVLIHNDGIALEQLSALKRLGVRLAIDDFGTGYSSLAYLQQFPVDILKIDKSFTKRLGAGPDESPLSRAVFGLGGAMKVVTIAEGVERVDQWDRLRDLACEFGQGYLFASPMDADGLQTFMSRPAPRPEALVDVVAGSPETRIDVQPARHRIRQRPALAARALKVVA